MVTLIVVGITLTLILQGLNTAKITAAHTHNRKVARELALYTLGEMEAGLFWEDLEVGDDQFYGTYAEQGYEAFEWEIIVGGGVLKVNCTASARAAPVAMRRRASPPRSPGRLPGCPGTRRCPGPGVSRPGVFVPPG